VGADEPRKNQSVAHTCFQGASMIEALFPFSIGAIWAEPAHARIVVRGSMRSLLQCKDDGVMELLPER
jgi:hypothetical protein